MNKNDALRELAGVCRRSPGAALWCLGFLAQGQSLEVLREALEGAREAADVYGGATLAHLEAYRERWGRLPEE